MNKIDITILVVIIVGFLILYKNWREEVPIAIKPIKKPRKKPLKELPIKRVEVDTLFPPLFPSIISPLF